ncbi:Uncharacterised protein [uncultured archaeon]|nr:Uncharacterised protein [uncultured archaeon]
MKLHIFPGVDTGAGVDTGVVVGARVGVDTGVVVGARVGVGIGVCVNGGRGVVVTGVGVGEGVIEAGVYWAVSVGVCSAAGTGVDVGIDPACSLFNFSTADSLVVCAGIAMVTGVDWLFFNSSPGNF